MSVIQVDYVQSGGLSPSMLGLPVQTFQWLFYNTVCINNQILTSLPLVEDVIIWKAKYFSSFRRRGMYCSMVYQHLFYFSCSLWLYFFQNEGCSTGFYKAEDLDPTSTCPWPVDICSWTRSIACDLELWRWTWINILLKWTWRNVNFGMRLRWSFWWSLNNVKLPEEGPLDGRFLPVMQWEQTHFTGIMGKPSWLMVFLLYSGCLYLLTEAQMKIPPET